MNHHSGRFVNNDTVIVLANGQVVIEALGTNPETTYVQDVLLPPGRSQIACLARPFSLGGRLRFEATSTDGTPLAWQAPAICR